MAHPASAAPKDGEECHTPASKLAPRNSSVRGAGVYVLHRYIHLETRGDAHTRAHTHAEKACDLTVFLVRDHTHTFTIPIETRDHAAGGDFERISVCASRATDEELHLPFSPDEMKADFERIYVPFLQHEITRYNAIHVLRSPSEKTIGFGAAAFAAEVSRLRCACAPWSHLETTGIAHVPVRDLLAAVPQNRTNHDGEFGLDRDLFVAALRAAGYRSDRDVEVADVHGKRVRLRNIFVWTLGHPEVRAALQAALDEFDAEK